MSSLSLDIKVWETQETYNEYGDKPQRVAKEYIDQAVTLSEHSVTLSTGNTYPDPAYECVDWVDSDACTNDSNQECVPDPCSEYGVCYSGLGGWWKRYANCQLDVPTDRDCDLLITNHTSFNGVCVDDQYSVAEGAYYLNQLDPTSTQAFLKGNEGNAVQTALHEVAHALTDHSNEHNLGITKSHDNELYHSPMCPTGTDDPAWEGENECQNRYYDAPDENWMEYWSECCEGEMEYTG